MSVPMPVYPGVEISFFAAGPGGASALGPNSFFQLLHQGTPRAALDFLLPARSSAGNQSAQDWAIANCLAQAEAFMAGQPPAIGAPGFSPM